MRMLIVGGTSFVGRHLTQAALAGGHTVTLANRGRNNPDLFPEAQRVRIDRSPGQPAYADPVPHGADESAPLAQLPGAVDRIRMRSR